MAPAVMEKKDKSCRMDVRLTRSQRAEYERAAALRGETLSQWTTSHLDECAKRDIAEASTTWLDSAAFDQFCALLEAPVPSAAQDLLARKPIWE